VIEMQGKRFLAGVLVWLIGLGLSACQVEAIPIIQEFSSPTWTMTPFQPQAPTPRPTATETPTPAPTPTPFIALSPTLAVCMDNEGHIEQKSISFGENRQPLTFRVYVPPCYDKTAAVGYPVLYMIHGQSYNDDQWDRLGIDEAADLMISAGEIPAFLIVMPREANTYGDIFTSSFSPDVIDGLIPWIDANYNTCAERRCRAIGGLSRGGAWAFRLGFIHWGLFGAIGLHSTPPFIGDPNRLPEWLGQIPDGEIPRIYMDSGRHDWYIRPINQLEGLLVQYGIPHEWYLFNGSHEEAYWSAHVADYLAWYAIPWAE